MDFMNNQRFKPYHRELYLMVNYKQLLRERLKFYFEVIYGMGKNKLLEDSQNYFIFGSWLS